MTENQLRDDEDEELDTAVPVVPYPSTTIPTIAAIGAVMTLAALVTALTEMEPYTWALAPFIFVFAALPYFGLAVRARRAMRPSSAMILTLAALITVAFGGYIYFIDVVATQSSVTASTFITVPLWQTLPVALAMGIIWLLEPRASANQGTPSRSEPETDESSGDEDHER